MKVEYDTGIRRICFVSVPPVIGVTVGILFIGWNTPLSEGEEYGAKLALHATAMKIATW